MFYTLEEIREQLQAGEDSFAEFKEIRFGARNIVSPNTEDLAGEIIAFANSEGGALFLGISKQGLVRGIENFGAGTPLQGPFILEKHSFAYTQGLIK